MRVIAILALGALLVVPEAATADIKRHKAIPEQFWGQWVPTDQSCPTDARPALSVTASAYTRADARCTIDWVDETAGRAGPIYSAHMRCSTGEQQPPAPANLILVSRENNVVSLGSDFRSLQTYQRCPAE
ncbi:hypothetical protein [Methylobacterium segetis]|uniref:hypothetical protein n=1 Tax=Methylobacterium segetis TaxID=2488750 RepID=UPI001044CA58|nr:hypothetical protein [Methylobacterium segetis]